MVEDRCLVARVDVDAAHEVGAIRGDPQLLVDDFEQPNGLCFSTDESLLYINDTVRAHIRVFDVAGDGTISNSRVLADGIGSGSLEISTEGLPAGTHDLTISTPVAPTFRTPVAVGG